MVLKFVFNFKAKFLSSFFDNYFHLMLETNNIPARFSSDDNLVVLSFNTSATQRSIRYEGCKTWNELRKEIKNQDQIRYRIFLKSVKS